VRDELRPNCEAESLDFAISLADVLLRVCLAAGMQQDTSKTPIGSGLGLRVYGFGLMVEGLGSRF